MIYRVKDFETKFERAQSRKVKEIKWIALSIDLSDSDLRRLGEHEQGTEIYAAWVLICQVAARAPIRGLLYKNGRPMTASDLHYETGFPESIFAVGLLELARIGWLEQVTADLVLPAPKGSAFTGET